MLLSRREYAAHRGVAVSAVQKAIETGRMTLTDGKIDPEKADKEWTENTNPIYNSPRTDDHSSNPYQKSKIMKTTYDAMLKKLEYEERAGKLIPRALVPNCHGCAYMTCVVPLRHWQPAWAKIYEY